MPRRRGARLRDHGGAPPAGRASWWPIPATAEILKPYYRYLCKRPCFHDEYLQAFNDPNVTLVDCPAASSGSPSGARSSTGEQYEVDCLVYGTGFEAELTPLYRRAGHEIVGRGGVTPGREVGRRRRQPLRDDEPRLPEPVRHAGARRSRPSSPSTTRSSPCSAPSSSAGAVGLLEQQRRRRCST